jgi:GAF domain-containing protein
MMPMTGWLVDLVARAPARVQVKLLTAFLAIAMLLIIVGAVGLQVLGGVNQRTEELIGAQRKIEAYRQVQYDTTSQLYSVSSALVSSDEPTLSRTLRQLNQLGYDVDRLHFVAKDEIELLGQFRQDYDRFVEIVTHGIEMIRAGRAAEAREIQAAAPLADRLERLTSQLVNKAEADMVAGIETSRQAYENSQWIVIAFALGSIMLALALGYIISWSLIGPVKQIEAQLKQVAAGHFTHRVDVVNRDELGALGADVNKMSEELGQLYQQLHQRTVDLSESLQQQTVTADVLKVISRSTFDLQSVLDTLIESATRLCAADKGTIHLVEGDVYRIRAHYGLAQEAVEYALLQPLRPGRSSAAGRVALEGKTIQIPDVLADPEYLAADYQQAFGYRTILGVPLLRDGKTIGTFALLRDEVSPFTDKQIELVSIFVDQAVIAMENARLLTELRETLQQQSATADVLKVISRSAFDLQTVLDTLVESAARLCDADSVAIHRPDGNSYPFVASYGYTREYHEYMRERPIIPGRGTVLGRAVTECKPIQVNDVEVDPEYTLREGQTLGGFRTVLGIPLLREGVPIGVIVLTRNTVRPFTDKQIELATTFADQAAIAIS